MAVWNFGSINLDHVYRVARIPAPGETIAAAGHALHLGGKGANQSVAAARAGAAVRHIGALGPEGEGARTALAGYGVDCAHVARRDCASGHAIVMVDDRGENAIVIHPGANRSLTAADAARALAAARTGDTLLMQNETSAQPEAAAEAAARGLRIVYSAAPFEIAALRAVLPFAPMLVMNAGEAAALRAAAGELPGVEMIVTRGAAGVEWRVPGQAPLVRPAFAVTAVDTTGAGDTFTGWLAAETDLGLSRDAAMRRAAAAAAIQVTRPGAAPAIPTAAEVDAFLAARGAGG